MKSTLLYDAEGVVRTMKFPNRFHDEASAQQYFDHVTNTTWFLRSWPDFHDQCKGVKSSKNVHGYANWETGMITLPFWALNDFTLLHEVSHFAEDDVDHGLAFRRTHIKLTRKYMGQEAARCYKYALLAHNIDV